MIEHTQLQSLIKRIKHSPGERSLKSDIMHPRREWAIGLSISIGLMIGVASLSYYLYTVASTTPELTAEQVDTVVPYREALIKSALKEYRTRALQYQAISQSGVSVAPATSTETTDPATEPILQTAIGTSTESFEEPNVTATTTTEVTPTETPGIILEPVDTVPVLAN